MLPLGLVVDSILTSVVDLQVFAVPVAFLSTNHFLHLHFCFNLMFCNSLYFVYYEQTISLTVILIPL